MVSRIVLLLKDHKSNFQNNPTVRLLNPAKKELSRISKTILGKINVNLCNSLHLNQWKNTQGVINLFKSIDNKQHYKFIMFDIILTRYLPINLKKTHN